MVLVLDKIRPKLSKDIEIDFVRPKDLKRYVKLKQNIFISDKNTILLCLEYFIESIPETLSLLFFKYNGEIIGIGGLKRESSYTKLFDFGILSEYRGKGLSKDCLYNLIAMLKEDGEEFLALKVGKTNNKAIELYTTLGFIKTL